MRRPPTSRARSSLPRANAAPPGGARSSPPRIRYASTQSRHTSNPRAAAIAVAARRRRHRASLAGAHPATGPLPEWADAATVGWTHDKAASTRPTPSPLAVRATHQLAPAAARQRDGEGGELAATRVARGRSRGRPRRRATHGDLGGCARPDPPEGDGDAPPPPSPQAAEPSGGQLRQRRGRERPTKGRRRLLGIMGSVRVARRGATRTRGDDTRI
ncbi:translation initiation factor IF-2-like [Zea mays]|jgi:hypothetical protein|uniref:Uncharacterized protein n=1 Tax=Zea mays TaxID=4577 RepID=B8A114_MAIZE|nr:translation initiation factor IF-2-like [Zea mays]ACL53863.1 unknown [Zea mays]ACN33780.1 unknown [Zea mays]